MRRLLLAFALPPALLGLACLGIAGYATYEHLAFSREFVAGGVVALVASLAMVAGALRLRRRPRPSPPTR